MSDLGKKSDGWSSIERLILCMICLLWAVKRHSPRLAGKHRQIPSFTMSMSGTHAQSRGETQIGRPGKSRRRHNGWKWWSQTGSNRRPQACKASALPTELWPRLNTRPPSLTLRRDSLRLAAGLPSRSYGVAKAGGPGKS